MDTTRLTATLAVLLLTPLALGQTPEITLLEASIEPFMTPVEPLKTPLETRIHVKAACALTGATGVPIGYAVTQAPAWATAVITPASDVGPIASCDQGFVETEATLLVMASDQAPAFRATPITVRITAGEGEREETTDVMVDLTASYFSVIDLQLAETMVTIPPGGSHEFRVKFTNFGNAQTRIDPRITTEKSEWSDATAPPAFLLGSKQQGATDISREVAIRVEARPASAFVNRVELISLTWPSAYADDATLAGEETTSSFLVTIKSAAGAAVAEEAATIPAPLPWLALLGAIALVRRRH